MKTFLCLCSMNLEKVFTNVTRDKLFSVFDNFSVRSNSRRVELSEKGLLIYNSEDSFFRMTGAGIELRGGSGVWAAIKAYLGY